MTIYIALTYSIPNLEPVCCSMSGSNCCFLTCIQISQEAGKVGLVFPCLEEFPTVCCDPHSQRLWRSHWSRSRCFSGILLLLLWSSGLSKKQESSRKTSTSALLTMPKPLTMWITTNCGKFWKIQEYPTTWDTSWEICMQVKEQQTWIWKNRLGPNRKGVHRGCILSPCLFNLSVCTFWDMLDWMKYKLESRLLGEISITSDMKMTAHLWQKVKKTRVSW